MYLLKNESKTVKIAFLLIFGVLVTCMYKWYSGHILVVRSSTQLEFVRPLLEQCNVELTLYCGKVFSEENIFHKAIELTAALDNIQVVELDPSSLGEVIKHYSNAVLKILTLKNVFYLKGDVRICVKQAIREILIMATEVELYKAQLQRSIPSNDFGNSILFTCEQKSPHGYIDSCVAIEKGYICVQLMTCDQECNDLPYPVYGDCFFVDTLKRLDLFRLNWSTSTESIYYEGSIKLLGNQGKLKSHISKFKFCYFADISEIEHNLKTIKYLELESIENGGFKYCIKLHPRDDGNWIKKMNFSNGTVIRHGDVSSADLFLSFDIAISNPSAVVMDLLCRDRVFIYLNILKFYRNVENVYTDQYYKGIVNKWQDFSILLKDPSILNSEVKALKKRVFGDKALIPSIESLAMKCATNLDKVKNVRN